MKIVESKCFKLGRKPGPALSLIAKWIARRMDQGYDIVQVGIGVGERRMTNKTARRILREIILGRDALWEAFGYSFDFNIGSYQWNGEYVYVTPCEALFLYRWLMRNDIAGSPAFQLRHLRERHGKDFLREVTANDSV
jgi:hypothetical protein